MATVEFLCLCLYLFHASSSCEISITQVQDKRNAPFSCAHACAYFTSMHILTFPCVYACAYVTIVELKGWSYTHSSAQKL